MLYSCFVIKVLLLKCNRFTYCFPVCCRNRLDIDLTETLFYFDRWSWWICSVITNLLCYHQFSFKPWQPWSIVIIAFRIFTWFFSRKVFWQSCVLKIFHKGLVFSVLVKRMGNAAFVRYVKSPFKQACQCRWWGSLMANF